MNIFFLDSNDIKCAQYHVDKHVVKMRLEYAQLCSFVHHLTGSTKAPYKFAKSFAKHPCTLWALESVENYKYISNLGLLLCHELEYRFGTSIETQQCYKALTILNENLPIIPVIPMTTPKLAMPNECKLWTGEGIEFGIANYREYYRRCKKHLYKWTNRDVPGFITY